MTKEEILDYVKEAGLRPADIVSMSYGLIPVTQAHDWLRTWKFSMSTTLLLYSYASKLADVNKAPVLAEIFQQPKVEPKKQVAEKKEVAVQAAPKKEPIEKLPEPQKIPAQQSNATGYPIPKRGGQTIFDKPMTYRPRNIGNHYFIAVYLDSGWYKVDAGTEKFEIDGVVYSMSDFKLAD